MASFILWLITASVFPFSAVVARDAIRSFDLAEILGRLTTTADKPNVLAARGPDEAGEMVKEYFASIGRKGLAALQNDGDTSLALQAAWALALDPDDVKAPPCPKRFVRFFEGRTGLKVPLSWEYAVVKARMEDSPAWKSLQTTAEKEYLPALKALNASKVKRGEVGEQSTTTKSTAGNSPTPGGAWIKRKKHKLIIHDGQAIVVMQVETLPEEMREFLTHLNCSVHIGPRRSFIVFHGGGYGEVFCVDSGSGKLLWQQDVWGTAYSFTCAGTAPFHYLTFLETNKQLILLGEGSSCFAEAFDLASGLPAFRFSTNLWWTANRTSGWSDWWRGLWR
jgi:hypothetical protein